MCLRTSYTLQHAQQHREGPNTFTDPIIFSSIQLILYYIDVLGCSCFLVKQRLILHGFYRRIHAGVIVYIFAHLHTALRVEGNMLDKN